MELLDPIVTGIVISTIILPILIYAIKHIVAGSIDHEFRVQLEEVKKHNTFELEKLRADLNRKSDIMVEISKRKMNSYSRLVEILYRIKKLSAGISRKISLEDQEVINDFSLQCKDLENVLYMSIIDLESDEIFSEIHDLKNRAINFNILLQDIIYILERNSTADVSDQEEQLRTMSAEIEESVRKVIKLFADSSGGVASYVE